MLPAAATVYHKVKKKKKKKCCQGPVEEGEKKVLAHQNTQTASLRGFKQIPEAGSGRIAPDETSLPLSAVPLGSQYSLHAHEVAAGTLPPGFTPPRPPPNPLF